MNSMFSSFDAFSAEFLGQKVKASFVSKAKKANYNTQQQQSQDSTKVVAKKQESQSSTNKKMPRFAPELDGINCFETLVPF
ncbi:Avr9/Cf-9 rapidly elicited protein [Melia azedarach]|uniref:Avr9/Cf-9 rapidly elicited protein n=1 Tax=Melia azedarach TaxID=155640 RepID=A0ACC1XNA2_MELAZ|nr:Avr9/Cf-9 rapidly elicited protein [Melia azedarach]